MKNKIKYGLKNVHYSVINEVNGIVSYGTPIFVPGAVNIVQNAAGEAVTFSADDIEDYYSEDVNNGYDGTLEMALIPDYFRVDVFDDEIDSNGALIENTNAKPKKIALMYEFAGDINRIRHVNYNVKVSRPNMDGSTKTNTKEPKTETMNISARPAIDTGDVKAKMEQDKPGYDTFFTAVYLKNSAINTVAQSSVTFSKASPADISIDATSSAGINKVKNVMIDGINVGGIYLTASGTDVTIDSDYISTLDNGAHTIIVEFEKGNAVTVLLTVTA